MEGNGQGVEVAEKVKHQDLPINIEDVSVKPKTGEVTPSPALRAEVDGYDSKRSVPVGIEYDPHAKEIHFTKNADGEVVAVVPQKEKGRITSIRQLLNGEDETIERYSVTRERRSSPDERTIIQAAKEVGINIKEDKPLTEQPVPTQVVIQSVRQIVNGPLAQQNDTREPSVPRNPHWAQELRPRTKAELPRLTDRSPLDAYRIKPIPDSRLSSTQDDDGIPQWLQRPSKHRVQYGAGIPGAVPETQFDDSSVAVAEPEENVVMPEVPATPTISANEMTELDETNLPPLFTEEKVGRFDYEAQRMEKEEQQKREKDEERHRRWPWLFPFNKRLGQAIGIGTGVGLTVALTTSGVQAEPAKAAGPNYTDSSPAFPENESHIKNGVKAKDVVEKVPFGAEPEDAVLKEAQSPLYSQETIKLQSGENIWLVTDQELHKLLPEVDDRDTNVATMMLTSMQVDENGHRTSRDAARHLPVGFPVRMLSKDALKLIHDINTGQGKPSVAKAQLSELFQTLDSPTYTKGKTSQELEQDARQAVQLLEKALIADKLDYQPGKTLNLGSTQGQ